MLNCFQWLIWIKYNILIPFLNGDIHISIKSYEFPIKQASHYCYMPLKVWNEVIARTGFMITQLQLAHTWAKRGRSPTLLVLRPGRAQVEQPP